ncbi:MAG: HEPN domain-containing protein [Gammaproteobacteria bacterium]
MPANRDVAAMRARLDAAFLRVSKLPHDDLEIRSDFARYLCILVSGFIENAVTVLATAYCRERSQAPVGNYAGSQLGRLQNLNSERLGQVIGAFERSWRDELTDFLAGPRKDALDSVLSVRNQIAHGESVGLTYTRIQEYYSRIKEIVSFLERLFG